MTIKNPVLSVIFPVRNGLQNTVSFLDSLYKQSSPSFEVLMVDNGSTDKTVAVIRKKYPRVKIIINNDNLGFSKAVNRGIKTAKGKYFFITNNDVILGKDYLKKLITYLSINPDIGIVGGKIFYPEPDGKTAFCGACFSFSTGLLRLGKSPDRISPTDWVPGCNMLIKNEVINKIGCFDEDFFFYFEDLDFCLRAKKAGFKVVYYPEAVLFHAEGASINKKGKEQKNEYYYMGKTRILFKHATFLQLLSVLLFQFFLGLPYHLAILKSQNYTPAIKALISNLKDPPDRVND